MKEEGLVGRLLRWPRYLLKSDVDPGHLYDLRGEGAIQSGGDVPLANMGLWDGITPSEPNALDRANHALFDLVGRGARLGAHSTVLDAGCGFGTNALHLMATFEPAHVTGVNVSTVQLASARTRAEAAGRSDRITFLHADVTKLPLPDASLDAVVSVEAAFHFDTRERFFAEAFRVLKPGGRLSMVDLVAPEPTNIYLRWALSTICRTQAMPMANVYDRPEYARRIGAAGFTILEEESIVDRVFPHFRRWQLTRPVGLMLKYDMMFALPSLPYLTYPWDYIRVVAQKPA